MKRLRSIFLHLLVFRYILDERFLLYGETNRLEVGNEENLTQTFIDDYVENYLLFIFIGSVAASSAGAGGEPVEAKHFVHLSG